MTVRELIEQLSDFPPNSIVVSQAGNVTQLSIVRVYEPWDSETIVDGVYLSAALKRGAH